MNLEAERKKALSLLAGKAGVEIEVVRPTVRTGLEVKDELDQWQKKVEAEQEKNPLQRLQEYQKRIKEQ